MTDVIFLKAKYTTKIAHLHDIGITRYSLNLFKKFNYMKTEKIMSAKYITIYNHAERLKY